MLKVILVSLFFFSFSASAGSLKSNEKVTLQKSFWCAAVSGDETIDFSVLVTKKDKSLIISFPRESYNLKKLPAAADVANILSSNKSLFLTDKSVEIDDLRCEEASVKQLLAYKEGLL
jgi:hypothetical protein